MNIDCTRILFALLPVSLMDVGCGADEPKSCEPAKGTYHVTLTERSGDCGGDFELVVEVGGDQAGEGCTGTQSVTDNGCSVESNLSCIAEDGAGRPFGIVEITSVVSQVNNGNTLEGTASFRITGDAGILCTGTYDLTYEKL